MRTMLAAAAVLAGSGMDASMSGAEARAYGIEYFGVREVGGYKIPSGQLAHLIEGKGFRIDTDGANFGVAGNLCEPSVRFTYGNGAVRVDGNVHRGCSAVGQWKYSMNRNVPRGSACAELWAQNWTRFVAKQCHYVHD